MRYQKINLKNLITDEKYAVTVSEGNGVIDAKGWDGVATGPNQSVLLSGDGLQKLLVTMVALGEDFSGTQLFSAMADDWYLKMHPIDWKYRTQIDSTLQLSADNVDGGAGGEAIFQRKFLPNSDFDFEVEPHSTSSLTGGDSDYHVGTLYIEMRNAANSSWQYRFFLSGRNKDASEVAYCYLMNSNNSQVMATRTTAKFATALIKNIRFTRIGNVGAIYYDGVKVIEDTIDPSIELDIRFRWTVNNISGSRVPTVKYQSLIVNYGQLVIE